MKIFWMKMCLAAFTSVAALTLAAQITPITSAAPAAPAAPVTPVTGGPDHWHGC